MTSTSTPSFREFVERIKDGLNIEQVVSEYVPGLTRAGKNFKAPCPFHKEKTPSFFVHPDMGFYHCFGCGAHGDVIRFVQEIEKIDFRLALEQLARRAGLPMIEMGGGEGRERGDEKRLDQLRELCRWAEEFFIEQLRAHPRGQLGRGYLLERGLSVDQIQEYRLGYAPQGYEVLLKAAGRRGWREETIGEAGLASRREAGGFIDRFRDRVMFPITDRMGQTVAFAGRLIEDRDDAAKYINSAESPIFRKSSLLYGLAAAREPIREQGELILLEGYMDWIAMHRHGLRHVLAGMGTALTEEQARLARRLTRKITLLYDGDDAGRKAMFRSSELLLRQGLEVHSAALPAEHDPDSFLQAEGTGAMRELVTGAPMTVDYFIGAVAGECDLARPEGKALAVDRIAPLLVAIQDPALREGYLDRAANGLGLRRQTLEMAINRRFRRRRPAAETQDVGPAEPTEEMPSASEQNLLYILLQYRNQWPLLNSIDPEWFPTGAIRSLFERIHNCQRDIEEGADPPADLFSLFEDETSRHWLSRILLLPAQRFGGEVADFDHHLATGLELQIFKLHRQASQRRARALKQDLQLILASNPVGEGQLEQIDELARENIRRHGMLLDGQSSPNP